MNEKPPAKNAFKYGVYSAHVVFPWEDENEFNTLHQGLREEFFPDGAMEEEIIQEIARYQWIKRRQVIAAQAPYRAPQAAPLREAAKGGIDGVLAYLHKNEESSPLRAALQNFVENKIASLSQHLDRLEKETAEWPDRLQEQENDNETRKRNAIHLYETGDLDTIRRFIKNPLQYPQEAPPAEQVILMEELLFRFRDLVAQQKSFSSSVKDAVQKLVELDRARSSFDGITRPEVIERNLKLEAEINKQIDKLFTRLVNLKEYKRLYSQKTVSSTRSVQFKKE